MASDVLLQSVSVFGASIPVIPVLQAILVTALGLVLTTALVADIEE